ncbi:MAG: hypothetical protein IPG47_17095, partial [Thermoflexaceae bacterium]|nr:hypothetical protein [Thermoflexaceae bacterium]
GLPHEARQHLRIYGDAVEDVLAGGLAELCPHAPALESEVTHAATAELGVTLADILLRRTGIAGASCRGILLPPPRGGHRGGGAWVSRRPPVRRIRGLRADRGATPAHYGKLIGGGSD